MPITMHRKALATTRASRLSGANWSSHKIMYIAGLEVLRVSFNDCFSPSQALWEPTNQVISNVNTATQFSIPTPPERLQTFIA